MHRSRSFNDICDYKYEQLQAASQLASQSHDDFFAPSLNVDLHNILSTLTEDDDCYESDHGIAGNYDRHLNLFNSSGNTSSRSITHFEDYDSFDNYANMYDTDIVNSNVVSQMYFDEEDNDIDTIKHQQHLKSPFMVYSRNQVHRNIYDKRLSMPHVTNTILSGFPDTPTSATFSNDEFCNSLLSSMTALPNSERYASELTTMANVAMVARRRLFHGDQFDGSDTPMSLCERTSTPTPIKPPSRHTESQQSPNASKGEKEAEVMNEYFSFELSPISKRQTTTKKKSKLGMSSRTKDSSTIPHVSKPHSKLKYHCEVCHKRFKRPSSLSTHMNIHTGHKPYHCPFEKCVKAFNAKSNMLRHYKLHFRLSPGMYLLPSGEVTSKKPTSKQLFPFQTNTMSTELNKAQSPK